VDVRFTFHVEVVVHDVCGNPDNLCWLAGRLTERLADRLLPKQKLSDECLVNQGDARRVAAILLVQVASLDQPRADGFKVARGDRRVVDVWLLTPRVDCLSDSLEPVAVIRATHR